MSTAPTFDTLHPTAPDDRPDADTAELRAVVAGHGLRSVFQPLVRLSDGALVGYEVLSRGPRGHRLEPPLELLGDAARAGLELELDRAMLGRGLRSTLALDPDPRLTFFFNVESRVARAPLPADLQPLLQQMTERGMPFTVEFTERSLSPATCATTGPTRPAASSTSSPTTGPRSWPPPAHWSAGSRRRPTSPAGSRERPHARGDQTHAARRLEGRCPGGCS